MPNRTVGIPYFLRRFLLDDWVRADAATLLTDSRVRGLLRSLEAFLATSFDVCSLLFLPVMAWVPFWIEGRLPL